MHHRLLGYLFIISLSSFAQEAPILEITDPYSTSKRIFESYIEFEESTDSQENLDSLKLSLSLLENQNVTEKELTLVINIWMYYTVTDFSSVEYTWNVLKSHKTKSINALKKRIKNKMSWESEDSAPYSDLKVVLKQLQDLK